MNAPASFGTRRKIGLRAADYLMLSDAGAFDGIGRTELIEGEIWAMNAIHSWHARTLVDLGTELTVALRAGPSLLRAYSAGSVRISDDSVPEPDVSIAEYHDDGILPLAKLKLAIEIADSTAAIDLGVKLRLYAQAGVPEYWVVERDTKIIHQLWSPSEDSYAERRARAFGESVTAATLAGIAVGTDLLVRYIKAQLRCSFAR